MENLHNRRFTFKPAHLFYLLFTVIFLITIVRWPGQSAIANNNAASRTSFPIPFRVDMQYYIQPSIYLSVDHVSYWKSFDAFSETKAGESEDVFQIIVTNISRGIFAEISSYTSDEFLKMEESNRDRIANAYRSMLNQPDFNRSLDQMNILEQFYLGNDRLFAWEMPGSTKMGTQRFVRSFKLEKDKQGTFLWNPSPPSSIEVLLNDSLWQFGRPMKRDEQHHEGEFQFEHLIHGNGTDHPVYLQFNAKKYYLDFLSSDLDKSDEIAVFYQKACRAFKEQGPLAHADFYTDKSRDRYRDWIMNMPEDRKNAYTSDTIKGGRVVRFIILADPVYVVFYENLGVNRMVGIDYIIRDPADDKLKLTNFNMRAYFQKLMIEHRNELLHFFE